MSSTNPNVANLIEIFIHSIDGGEKLIRDFDRPIKVELNNLWNKVRENAANIPNPTCIGGYFKLAICTTNGSEWLSAELGRINQPRLEVAEGTRISDNAKAAAASPVQPPDTSIINYTVATEADIDPLSKAYKSR
mmetsp:Transcript_29761/g.30270  ORF Transcript_29761/g.30270 Transcript_29761/m.30270 type:complete len:135 (+) Transcript_29761:216-620(+)